jgi:TPR repeat protein
MANTHVRSAAEIARLVRAEQGGCGESAFALYKHYVTVREDREGIDEELLTAFKYMCRGVELQNPKAQYQMGKNHRDNAAELQDGDAVRAKSHLEAAFAMFRSAAPQGGTVRRD